MPILPCPVFNKLRKSTFIFLVLLSLAASQIVKAEPDIIPIVVSKDTAQDYVSFLEDVNLEPEEITFFGGKHSRRDVAELILFIQALKLGGYAGQITIHPQNNIRRYLRRFSQGEFAAWATPLSLDFIKDHSNIVNTAPVTYEGEFEAGLYVLPENNKALSIRSLADLKRFCVVSSDLWVSDWKTLTALGLPCLHSVNHWSLMLQMVKKGRSDIILAPFQNTPDMKLITNDAKLIPIPSIKLALLGDRRWLVSSLHPMGKITHTHLEKGLKTLRKKGVITKAYTESGAWSPNTTRWKRLNLLSLAQ